MRSSDLEQKAFLLLLAVVSIAFAWILSPFFGAVFWAVALAIVFEPLQRAMLVRLKGRANWAALATLVVVLLLVIIPAAATGALVVQEAGGVIAKLRSGEIDLASYYQRVVAVLPDWAGSLLQRFGIPDLPALQKKLGQSAAQGGQPIATQIWEIGQDTLNFVVSFFVMLYLLFFLLRDHVPLMRRIRRAVPLDPRQQKRLFDNFVAVVRATVKGNVVVAAIQGALGGVAFMVIGIPGALLWGVVMGFLSLLPSIGAALVWGPVALYLLATGSIGQGVALAVFGTLVIGLVDNLLRPVLVGKSTRMPDYLVLLSTLGGMALFGLNGFVIGPVIAAIFLAAWDLSASSQATED